MKKLISKFTSPSGKSPSAVHPSPSMGVIPSSTSTNAFGDRNSPMNPGHNKRGSSASCSASPVMERSASYAGAGTASSSTNAAHHDHKEGTSAQHPQPLPSQHINSTSKRPQALSSSSKRSSAVGTGNSRRQSIAETQQMLRNIIPPQGNSTFPSSQQHAGTGSINNNLLLSANSPNQSKKVGGKIENPCPSPSMSMVLQNGGALPGNPGNNAMNGAAGGGNSSNRMMNVAPANSVRNSMNAGNNNSQQLGAGTTTGSKPMRQLSHGEIHTASNKLGDAMKQNGVGSISTSRSAGQFQRMSESTMQNLTPDKIVSPQRDEGGGDGPSKTFASDGGDVVFNINIVAPRSGASRSSSSGMLRSSSESDDDDEDDDDRKFQIEDEKRRSITGVGKRSSMNLNAKETTDLQTKIKTQTLKIQELEATSRRDSFRADSAEAEVERLQMEEKMRKIQIQKLEEELRRQKLGENPYSTTSSSDSDDDDDYSDEENNQGGFTIVRTNTEGRDQTSEVITRLDPTRSVDLKNKDGSCRASSSSQAQKQNKRDKKRNKNKPGGGVGGASSSANNPNAVAGASAASGGAAASDARVKKLEREIALVRKQGVEKDHEVIRLKSEVEVLKNKCKATTQTRVQIEKMRNEMTEQQKKNEQSEQKLKQQIQHWQNQVAKFRKLNTVVENVRAELSGSGNGGIPGGATGPGGSEDGCLTLACQNLVSHQQGDETTTNALSFEIARDMKVCDYLRQELLSGELATRRSIVSQMPSACQSRIMSRQGSLSKLNKSGAATKNNGSKLGSRLGSRTNSNDQLGSGGAAGSSGTTAGGAGGTTNTSSAGNAGAAPAGAVASAAGGGEQNHNQQSSASAPAAASTTTAVSATSKPAGGSTSATAPANVKITAPQSTASK
ncbi:unnamed protein product [Amoebophrya sp. A120]|nr:unnamed protein product [Amoebophrya sp. A120]|eukprot:GSA120T00008266001.1